MWRAVLAVVVGFVVIVLGVMLADALASVVLGLAFESRNPPVAPPAFLVYSLAMGFLAAVLGGYVAAVIARGFGRAVVVLAGLLLVLGLATAVAGALGVGDPGQGQEPPWFAFTLPFLGCAGVLLGGRLKRRRPLAQPAG
jgi:xanthine/uracil permease